MQYDRFTRLLHLLIAAGITIQMLLTLVMVHPKPGREANVFFEVHEILGVGLLGALVVHWLWSFVRRGPVPVAQLFPWFSGERLQAVKDDAASYLRHLTDLSLPSAEEPSPLAGAIQGIGLVVATLLAITGTVILVYAVPGQKMVGWLHDVKEVHEALGPLMWGYLALHVGAGMLHQAAGHGVIGPMINPLRKTPPA